MRYLARTWGARNLTLALATRAAPPSRRRGWLAANVAIDVIDVGSGALFLRRHDAGPVARITAIAPAVLAAGCGIAARRSRG